MKVLKQKLLKTVIDRCQAFYHKEPKVPRLALTGPMGFFTLLFPHNTNTLIQFYFSVVVTLVQEHTNSLLISVHLPALASLQNITIIFFKWCWTWTICASMSHIFAPCIITSIPNLPFRPPDCLESYFCAHFFNHYFKSEPLQGYAKTKASPK